MVSGWTHRYVAATKRYFIGNWGNSSSGSMRAAILYECLPRLNSIGGGSWGAMTSMRFDDSMSLGEPGLQSMSDAVQLYTTSGLPGILAVSKRGASEM